MQYKLAIPTLIAVGLIGYVKSADLTLLCFVVIVAGLFCLHLILVFLKFSKSNHLVLWEHVELTQCCSEAQQSCSCDDTPTARV